MAETDTFALEPRLAKRVREEAAAHGLSPESFLSEAVAAFLSWGDEGPSSAPLTEEDHDRIAEETIRNGDGIPWTDFRQRLLSFGRGGSRAAD